MKEGIVTVDQKVDEKVSGVMIGTSMVNFQGGKVTIHEQADVVNGTMIGGIFGTIGGTPKEEIGQAEAMLQLESILRMDVPKTINKPSRATSSKQKRQKGSSGSSATCPSCHKPVETGWKFCPACQASLPAAVKYCVSCGHEVSSSDKFCSKCGKKVE